MSSSHPERLDPLGIGALFQGRYRIVREIGSGGMGSVYEVVDERTRGPRALKVMHEALAMRAPLRARFEQEAHVTSAIESEHLLRVYDAGAVDGRPFMVMDLLHGRDLASILNERRTLPAAEVITLLGQVGRALDRTHAAGVVHRDIKPENLFVTVRDDGAACIKILDFGVAKIFAEAQLPSTRTVGTPLYMAPEQIRGDGDVGPQADIYAIGHLAYAMLVGEPYWWELVKPGTTLVPVMMRVLEGSNESAHARALRRSGKALPEAFDVWFRQATALEPRDRFRSASEAVDALSSCLMSESDLPLPRVAATTLTLGTRSETTLGADWPALATLPTEHGEMPAPAPLAPTYVGPSPVTTFASSPPPLGDRAFASAPPAKQAAPPPPLTEPTPRWAFFVIGGAAMLLVTLAVVAIALRRASDHGRSQASVDATGTGTESAAPRSSASSETAAGGACPAAACLPLVSSNLAAVPPEDVLLLASEMARSLDREAVLTNVSAADVWVGGAFDLRGSAPPLSLTFASPSATFTFSVANAVLQARRGPPGTVDRLPPTACGFDRAWATARKAGFSSTARASLYYRLDPSGRALLQAVAEHHVLYIDPATCDVVREFR